MIKDKWKDDRVDFHHRIIPILKKFGREIGSKADGGDLLAQKIIRTYSLLYKSFDPINYIILDDLVRDYLARHQQD